MPKSASSPAASRITMMTTVGRMPVIAEDDSLPPVIHPLAAALPPPPPSRSTKPRSSYGRSPATAPVFPHPSYPPPVSRSSSRGSSRSTLSTLSTRNLFNSDGSVPNSGASTPRRSRSIRSTHKDRSRLLPITTPVGTWADEEKRGDGTHRRRVYRLLVIGIIVVGLVVGLSVGLTVGKPQSSPPDTSGASAAPNVFPAGSFAFNTALLASNASCTSDPATWRCYPYQTYNASTSPGGAGANASYATFFWRIAPVNSYAYQVSSSRNPFAPQFANLTMALLDGNSYNERLVFNFTLAKTAVPARAITPDGRAATCTFAGTAMQATLWTRRRGPGGPGPGAGAVDAAGGNATMAVSDGTKWADWPGEVEVVQLKTGGPECKDYDGNAIDVAAAPGQCECRYADFGLNG